VIDFDGKANVSQSERRISHIEVGLAIIISAFFAFYIWRLYLPAHQLQMGSDQHNIASFASAFEYPQRYRNDMLLSDPANYQWYTPLYVTAIRCITRLTGNYATTFVGMLLLTVTVFMSGTYFLLKYVSGSRFLSAGLAFLITVVLVKIPVGGDWTLILVSHMRPNTLFMALLPWVLLFAIWSRNHVMLWPVVGACSAFLIYVHPVSAPAWGLAIFAGLLWTSKEYYSVKVRFWGLLLFVAVAVLVVAPYCVIFLRTYSGKQLPPEQFESIREYAVRRFLPGSFDLGLALRRFVTFAWQPGMRFLTCFLLLWAITGQVFAWLCKGQSQTVAKFFLFGLAFFLFVTVGLTFVDQLIARLLKRFPFQIDLIRGLKFWPFWLLLLGTPGFAGLRTAVLRRNVRPRFELAVASIILVVIAFLSGGRSIRKHKEKILAKTAVNIEFREKMLATNELVEFIEKTLPADATFGGKCWPIWLRHTPGRGVVMTPKDSGALFYSSYHRLAKNIDRLHKQQQADTPELMDAFWGKWGADYSLYEAASISEYDGQRIVFSNSHWIVVKLNTPADQ
jgi:hypothetical protein